MLDEERQQEIYSAISDAVIPTIQEWIEEYEVKTGIDRRTLSVQCGRALALAGFSFAGAALELPAEPTIDICKEGLQRLGAIALERAQPTKGDS